MKSQSIREQFTDFFVKKAHSSVASSSLVPEQDPSLLFTNAGMVQFKDVFLGEDLRAYKRATSVQKCVRAGGKHNDLENVGFTARHHTFFEMLGNFSFGDYFKRDAIMFAWELLTKVFHLPPEKLWITVFDQDQEAENIWLQDIGIDKKRLSRIGAKDNFWAMGDTGPCGPCTEIFYDHGAHIPGGPPGGPEADLDRYIEIWNLVFMQFNRDANGHMHPLPKPSVDTGMGLERIAAVLQGVHDNYDIDTFKYLIAEAAHLLNYQDLASRSLRVIADHIRAVTFLINDGVMPSNEGRGYVLRRIIRRAIRHGYKLGARDPFLCHLVKAVVKEMGAAYPEIVLRQTKIAGVLEQEEQQFAHTLSQGIRLFEGALESINSNIIPGDVVFKLYDTYGFPMDLTADMARERGLFVDEAGFEVCMEAQRERARAHSKFKVDYGQQLKFDHATEFLGYSSLSEKAKVLAILIDGVATETLKPGVTAQVVLSKSPFYPEGGGQVGDQGVLRTLAGEFTVRDAQKNGDTIVHLGTLLQGELTVGVEVSAEVDILKRSNCARNHSATHLLHAALREVLGAHVEQKGSLVTPENLRFDFVHTKPLSAAEKKQVEDRVNAAIAANIAVETIVTDQEQAKKLGAMALFGEKYGASVRVLKMGAYSIEFCGGTHVSHTGDIGMVKIISESGIAAGVRRIEALTSMSAKTYLEEEVAAKTEEASSLRERLKQSEKALIEVKTKWVLSTLPNQLLTQVEDLGQSKLLVATLEALEPNLLMPLVNELKTKLASAVIVLALPLGDKVQLIAGVTSDLTARVQAGTLVNQLAGQLGGKGGGRPELAQAGGNFTQDLARILAEVRADLHKRFSLS